ncbi:MAG: polyphosphate polymerase domain-containing protein [Clostridia bacterium]|nr:polyphosphate polymerase domain-containing protein [Clostridia bacterium]MBQ2191669.1 polyphosphate polymerase domain-containing protein [Clostridia bacterium]MBQ5487533.1 polyphosphate polymerase domain-containing protein [Clostridia bacterium]
METAHKNIFSRLEKKYIITEAQYKAVMPVLTEHMHGDEHGLSTVCSMYVDTPDMRIIRASIDAKAYKEKLRLRCYGIPTASSLAFVELKKKYLGTVYKRRFEMPYEDALNMLWGKAPAPDTQMGREVDYFLHFYPGVKPTISIFCERLALFGNDDEEFRVTFDHGLRYRMDELDLRNGTHGRSILPSDQYIMEVKVAGGMPLWFCALLDENRIFPHKFSKYRKAFETELAERLGLNKES